MGVEEELRRVLRDDRLDVPVRSGAERSVVDRARRRNRWWYAATTAGGALTAVALVGGGVVLTAPGGTLPPAPPAGIELAPQQIRATDSRPAPPSPSGSAQPGSAQPGSGQQRSGQQWSGSSVAPSGSSATTGDRTWISRRTGSPAGAELPGSLSSPGRSAPESSGSCCPQPGSGPAGED